LDNAAWSTITTTGANATSYSNTGLTASTRYYYRLSAVNGTVSSSSITADATTLGTSFNNIVLEAEAGTITSPMAVQSDATASGGKYIMAPTTSKSTTSAPTSGYSTLTFTATGGSYKMWFKTLMASTSVNSFWYRIDGGTWVSWNVDADVSTVWQWNSVTALTLSAGSHTLTIAYREGGTKLDRIAISNDPAYDPAVTLKSEVVAEQESGVADIAVANNPVTDEPVEVTYTVPTSGNVRIVVSAITGQSQEILNENKEAGVYSLTLDGSKLLPGINILGIYSGGKFKTIKLIKL
jgi:hypothetical protein